MNTERPKGFERIATAFKGSYPVELGVQAYRSGPFRYYKVWEGSAVEGWLEGRSYMKKAEARADIAEAVKLYEGK